MYAPFTVVSEKIELPTTFCALTCALISEPQAIENGYTIRAEMGTKHYLAAIIIGSVALHVAVWVKKTPPRDLI